MTIAALAGSSQSYLSGCFCCQLSPSQRVSYAAQQINSARNGMTSKFGWLQAPATISKSCIKIVLRNKRRANWHPRFIAQFAQSKSQPSFLAPFPPISLVVPQLRRVEVDQVLRMA